MTSPKTITIYLPEGDPKGVKTINMTNRTVQATYIPRNKLDYLKQNSDEYGVSVYILYGLEDDKEIVYFGETEDAVKRIFQHNEKKDFWQYAVIITTKDKSFTKTHVKYLEQLCIKKACEVDRYNLDNSNSGLVTHASKSILADIHDAFETLKVYVGVLGLKVFEATTKEKSEKTTSDIFYYESKSSNEWKASAEYTEEGLVVHKGSLARLVITIESPSNVKELRQKLIDTGVLVQKNNGYKFTKDYVFNSPSLAANVIKGGYNNGWKLWVNNKGLTLSDKYRG